MKIFSMYIPKRQTTKVNPVVKKITPPPQAWESQHKERLAYSDNIIELQIFKPKKPTVGYQ